MANGPVRFVEFSLKNGSYVRLKGRYTFGNCLKNGSYVRLKGRYTFGNCQRPVFSLGVSHHKHKITSL